MESIKYFSTNLNAKELTFSEAILKGIAEDKGLFMPKDIPNFTKEQISSFSKKEYYEIAFEVIRKFLVGQIEDKELLSIVKEAYNFPVPIENVYDNKFVMRLDQGPTASFKDFAARMMGRLIEHFLSKKKGNLLILTATSGDTGSAMANAFYGLSNVKVLVLFPETEVTERQRKQMTTLGKNIQIIALDGKFDDCQALVKEAFSDTDLDYLNLSSANSINIGRLIPQIVYYFYAFAHLRKGNENDDIVFSVPSGNFGNLMGGILAKQMGLPVKKFVVAVNENDEFPIFLKTGIYNKVEPSKNCLSSAMNVGHPSNLARLISIYSGTMNEKGNILKKPNLDKMREDIFSVKVSDSETKKMLVDAWNNHKLLLEPHGSVAWKGLSSFVEEYKIDSNQLCVALETAHPAKFPEQIVKLIDVNVELPDSLANLESKQENFDKLKNNYSDFKKYLVNNY